MLLIVRVVPLWFVTVSVSMEFEPTLTLPKFRPADEKTATGLLRKSESAPATVLPLSSTTARSSDPSPLKSARVMPFGVTPVPPP